MAMRMAPLSSTLATADETPAEAREDDGLRGRALAKIMQFLLEASGAEAVVQRAVASLGLLPEVHWAEMDGPSPGSEECSVTLSDGATARKLTVQLADPANVDARQTVDTLLSMVRTVYGRELQMEALRAQAHTDPLTGLWNRRGFEPFLDQALARAARTGEDIALILCDVDHFKTINDTLGHHAGDRALQTVASALRSVIRPTDAVARLGGDEMALLLSGCSARGAIVVAERLRDALEASGEVGSGLPLTLSIGIADTQSLEVKQVGVPARDALLQAADEAMYEAKRGGRNRHACHPRSFSPHAVLEDDHTAPLHLKSA